MAIRKYWTIRGGVVGTAHKNRNGEEVDFRPARVDFRPPASFKVEEETADEEAVQMALRGVRVKIWPAKGVKGLEHIELVPHPPIEHEVEVNDRGVVKVTITRATVTHEGIDFEASPPRYIWERAVWFSSLAKRQAIAMAKAEAERKLREQPAEMVAFTPGQAIRFGKPVWSWLRSDRCWQVAAQGVRKAILRHFGVDDEHQEAAKLLPEWMRTPESIRSCLLEEKAVRRARTGSKNKK